MSTLNESLDSLFSSSEGSNSETLCTIKKIYEQCDEENNNQVSVSKLITFIKPFMQNNLQDLLSLSNALDPGKNDPLVSSHLFCKEMLEWTKKFNSSEESSPLKDEKQNKPLVESTPRKSFGIRQKLVYEEAANLNISAVEKSSFMEELPECLEKSVYEEQIKQLQYNNKICLEEIELLKTQLASQEDNNLHFQNALEEIKRLYNHEKELNETLVKQSKTSEDVQDNTASLMRSLHQLQKKIAIFEKNNKELKEANSQIEQEKQKLEERISHLHQSLLNNNKKIVELETDLGVKQTQIQTLEVNNLDLTQQIKARQASVEKYEEKIAYLNTEKEKLDKALREQIRKQAQITDTTNLSKFKENVGQSSTPTLSPISPSAASQNQNTFTTHLPFASPIKTDKFCFYNYSAPIAKRCSLSPMVTNDGSVEVHTAQKNTFTLRKTATAQNLTTNFNASASETSILLEMGNGKSLVNGSSSEDDLVMSSYENMINLEDTNGRSSLNLKDELDAIEKAAGNLTSEKWQNISNKENLNVCDANKEVITSLEKDLKGKCEIIQELDDRISELTKKYDITCEELKKAEEQLENQQKLTDEIASLKNELETSQEQLSQLKLKLQTEETTLKSLQEKQAVERNDIMDNLNASQQKYSNVLLKLESSEQKFKDLTRENEMLCESKTMLTKTIAEYQKVENLISDFNTNKNLTFQQKINALIENNYKYSELKLMYEEVLSKLEELQSECSNLKNKIPNPNPTLSHSRINRKLEQAHEKNNDLLDLLEEANKRNALLEDTNAQLLKKKANLVEQLSKLGNKLNIEDVDEFLLTARSLQNSVFKCCKSWLNLLERVPECEELRSKLSRISEMEDEGIDTSFSLQNVMLNVTDVLNDMCFLDFATNKLEKPPNLLLKTKKQLKHLDSRPVSPDSPNLENLTKVNFECAGDGTLAVDLEQEGTIRDVLETLKNHYSVENLNKFIETHREKTDAKIEERCTQVILENVINCSVLKQKLQKHLMEIQEAVTDTAEAFQVVYHEVANCAKAKKALLAVVSQLPVLYRLVEHLGILKQEWKMASTITLLSRYTKHLEEKCENSVQRSCRCTKFTRHQSLMEISPYEENLSDRKSKKDSSRCFTGCLICCLVFGFVLLFVILFGPEELQISRCTWNTYFRFFASKNFARGPPPT